MANYKKSVRKLKDYWTVADMGGIARRYFAINMFDEILTIIGILVASFFAGVQNPKIVISACIGAAIAMAVSGIWGAYLTEKAEREGKIKLLERKLSVHLRKSPVGKAHRFAAIFLGLVDGLLPLFVTPLMIFPLFLNMPITAAYQFSILLSFIFLFITGMFLGKISRENLVLAGVKMIIVGIICAAIIFLVGKII